MSEIRRHALPILAAILGVASMTPARAESSPWPDGGGPYLGVDFLAGTPSALRDVFRAGFPGASLRYIASRNIEFSLDYAFMETEYYYPESPAGPWRGPVEWSSMPTRFAGMRSSWIFYHTKHFLAPQAWYVAPLDELGLPLAIRLGAGPAISFVVPNEAAHFYPGLADAFDLFTKSFDAWLGLSLRAGLEYRPWRLARLGVEYLFVVDSLGDVTRTFGSDPLGELSRSGNLICYAGFRL